MTETNNVIKVISRTRQCAWTDWDCDCDARARYQSMLPVYQYTNRPILLNENWVEKWLSLYDVYRDIWRLELDEARERQTALSTIHAVETSWHCDHTIHILDGSKWKTTSWHGLYPSWVMSTFVMLRSYNYSIMRKWHSTAGRTTRRRNALLFMMMFFTSSPLQWWIFYIRVHFTCYDSDHLKSFWRSGVGGHTKWMRQNELQPRHTHFKYYSINFVQQRSVCGRAGPV